MAELHFKLPDVGEGIAEAEIVAWHVAAGDLIAEDQPLVDVMTDKATVEITSPVSGRVLSVTGDLGAQAAVGSVVAVIETDADSASAPGAAEPPPSAQPPAAPPAPTPLPPPPETTKPAEPAASPRPPVMPPRSRPLAAPAVRRRALEMGVRMELVRGTGPAGRVMHADLDAYAADPAGAFTGSGPANRRRDSVETVKVIGLRRAIATRMAEAKRRIPHFAYIEEIDVTELERLRAQLNALHKDRPRVTVLPFLVRALTRALPDFPQMNARFDDDAGEVHRFAAVHVGVATQTPGGLVVPVLRHAESLDLWSTAAEIARLAEAARSGRASRDELTGSTITITSLGPLGGLSTTPVINAPEVAILGPNRIIDRPAVVAGEVVMRKLMNLSSSFDHRVVDGWDAAEFIQRLKALLETPALMFVEEP